MKKNVLTDGDSWLNRGLSRLFDILLFGIITMVLCLPVITIGAAITANMDVYLQCALEKDGKLSIAQVAEMSGFASEESFRRNFRNITGKSPSDWTGPVRL